MICKKCGFELKSTDNFCPSCGLSVKESKKIIRAALKTQLEDRKVVCWNCGAKINAIEAQKILGRFGNVYCDKCGEPQNIDKTELEIRKSLLHTLKP